MRALGVEVEDVADDELVVHGVGLRGLRAGAVDCANAGTLMRLLAGVARRAGRRRFELTGDESLSPRPMERIAEPLRRMGAERRDDRRPRAARRSTAPARCAGSSYELPVASAQVKSAVLLAGLNADGRDDGRRAGADARPHRADARGGGRPRAPAPDVGDGRAGRRRCGSARSIVPGDFSSAAPLLVAAALVPGSDVTVHDLGLNPRRTGLLDVLERMGARVSVFNRRRAGREPVGDVQVQHARARRDRDRRGRGAAARRRAAARRAARVARARRDASSRGAAELRVKESDRIEAVTDGLRACGAHGSARAPDGWTITGVPTRLRGGRVDARGDHRIAMLGAVAGLASREGVEIEGADTVAISFPGFYDLLDSVVRR